MRTRPFGVELEFSAMGRGRNFVHRVVREAGIDVADNYPTNHERWYCGYDGSEVELKSPILTGEKGLKELKTVMNALTEAGCYTGRSDGMHVHFDASDFIGNKAKVEALLESWVANQSLIFSFVNTYRQQSNWCAPMNNRHLTELRRMSNETFWQRGNGFGRRSLNLDALTEHGTFEIRLHEGTLDYKQAEAWIKFMRNFIDGVSRSTNGIEPTEDVDTLLERIRVPKRVKPTLYEKYNRQGGAPAIVRAS